MKPGEPKPKKTRAPCDVCGKPAVYRANRMFRAGPNRELIMERLGKPLCMKHRREYADDGEVGFEPA